MKVRLTRKLADCIDGVDLSDHRVGDVLDLPASESRVLIAEDWATDRERRHVQAKAVDFERRRIESAPLVDEPDSDREQAS
jgi:hypothetical protein